MSLLNSPTQNNQNHVANGGQTTQKYQNTNQNIRLPFKPSISLPHDQKLHSRHYIQTSYRQNSRASKKNHEAAQNAFKIDISQVFKASKLFNQDQTINNQIPLSYNKLLSEQFDSQIYIKRQEHQRGRSYKIRGAYYLYLNATESEKEKGVVCVSDGNFATAAAIIAGLYKFKTIIYVPLVCYQHKIDFMKQNGGQYVEIKQIGKDFEECWQYAKQFCQKNSYTLLQPHACKKLMTGYATIASQIHSNKQVSFDYILVPSGGGALVCSIASFFKQIAPQTKVIAVQPQNCKPFSQSIMQNKMIRQQKVSHFCSGSSVRSIGEVCFQMGKTAVDGFISVDQNRVATRMIKLYSMGIISEPSGALAITGLQKVRNLIKGKKVLCILTGANMDLARYQEAREMNSTSKGYKNFFMINLPNKNSAVYDLIVKCFKKTDVITIQYSRNMNKNSTHTLIAIQSLSQQDVEDYIQMFNQVGLEYENVTERDEIIELFF